MLLYGPPGTGKTLLARAMAATRGGALAPSSPSVSALDVMRILTSDGFEATVQVAPLKADAPTHTIEDASGQMVVLNRLTTGDLLRLHRTDLLTMWHIPSVPEADV